MINLSNIVSGKKDKKYEDRSCAYSSPFIGTYWLNPKSKEIYRSSVEYLDTRYIMGDEAQDFEYEDFQGCIFDCLDEGDSGLIKIIVKVKTHYSECWTDCGYEYDSEFEAEILFKGKCHSFGHLRAVWTELRAENRL